MFKRNVKLYFFKRITSSVTAMVSSSKTKPVKGKEGKRERSESRERPKELRELVPTETNQLALLLRVQ